MHNERRFPLPFFCRHPELGAEHAEAPRCFQWAAVGGLCVVGCFYCNRPCVCLRHAACCEQVRARFEVSFCGSVRLRRMLGGLVMGCWFWRRFGCGRVGIVGFPGLQGGWRMGKAATGAEGSGAKACCTCLVSSLMTGLLVLLASMTAGAAGAGARSVGVGVRSSVCHKQKKVVAGAHTDCIYLGCRLGL